MFDINKIGKKISSLRKEKGLTQMELADRLCISFQAVSNWERGNTMPDISKLPELAEIFGVSIEDILGDERKAKIVKDIADGQTPADVKVEDLADIAPIINDEQFKRTYEQTKQNADQTFSIETLLSIAPFLDSDVLSDLILNCSEHGFTLSQAAALAPFLDEKALHQVANNLMDGEVSVEEIAAIAPFLDEEDVGKIAGKYLTEGTSIYRLCGIAPFMSEKDLGKLAKKCAVETDGFCEIAGLAPFLNEEDLTDIARDYLKNGGDFNGLMAIAPFLDINKLFREFYKK